MLENKSRIHLNIPSRRRGDKDFVERCIDVVVERRFRSTDVVQYLLEEDPSTSGVGDYEASLLRRMAG